MHGTKQHWSRVTSFFVFWLAVVAGLLVASDVKDTKDLKSTSELYRKHLANLPEGFRSDLCLATQP
jgi:hypothetical protein